MTAPSPRVSVVLACYNEAEHIEASFAEIRETLAQTGWSFEILLVDDVSRDRTREILQRIVTTHPRLDLKLILHDQYQSIFKASIEACRKSVLMKRKKLEVAIDTTPVFGRGAVKDTFNLISDQIRCVVKEVVALIRRMSRENPTWGVPRIQAELRLLGHDLAESTVAKYRVKTP